MSYEFYKIAHLLGIFFLVSGLMGVFFTVWAGTPLQGKIKSASFAMHGIGLVIMLVTGFGLLAKLGLASSMPTWAYLKFGLWAFFAVAISILKRKGQIGMPIYILLLIGYFCAAYIGVMKPAF
ncbi:MAG: hypothetical protein H7Z71_10650 [Moraxellaceae bacterium]|nr:hypothetical protein [Pseudobdellovibrionaceae bacterium]